ncbi:MAG: hypothetical protein WAW96_03460 [Alphaproteobacteria bacterium]
MNIAKTIKMTALAGLSAIALAGVSTAASAHQSYVRCDRDGDRCVRVTCDRDGDDCRRTAYYNNSGRYRDNDRGHRQLVCDRWGHGCHYVWVDGRGYYRGQSGAYLRFNVR